MDDTQFSDSRESVLADVAETEFSAAIQHRKAEHIQVCLTERSQFARATSGFERYHFTHVCLPELDYSDIDLSTQFLGKPLRAPLLISSMTGGTELAEKINYRLAAAAQAFGIAMGVGSQRVALEVPTVARTFAVRSQAPDIPLFANLGAVQLNYGCGLAEAQKLVDLLEADALILHLNPLQECVQTGGDRNFKGLFAKIATLCRQLPVPVIAKEVGNGISAPMAQRLIEAGVAAIDVAGAGGTSWAKVEGERANDARQKHLGNIFAEWGLPTAECVVAVRQVAPTVPLIASGGIRNGIEVNKAIALGADLVGMASPFLKAACESEAALHHVLTLLLEEMRIALFCVGLGSMATLRNQGRQLLHPLLYPHP